MCCSLATIGHAVGHTAALAARSDARGPATLAAEISRPPVTHRRHRTCWRRTKVPFGSVWRIGGPGLTIMDQYLDRENESGILGTGKRMATCNGPHADLSLHAPPSRKHVRSHAHQRRSPPHPRRPARCRQGHAGPGHQGEVLPLPPGHGRHGKHATVVPPARPARAPRFGRPAALAPAHATPCVPPGLERARVRAQPRTRAVAAAARFCSFFWRRALPTSGRVLALGTAARCADVLLAACRAPPQWIFARDRPAMHRC